MRSVYDFIYTIGTPSLVSAFWDLYHFQENALFHTCVEQLVVKSLDGKSGLFLALGFTAGPHRDP